MHGIAAAQALNIADELRRLYGHYLREAQGQALLGALGVVLLMAAWLRSLPRLLAVCKPLALAVLLTMAGFAAFGVPLGILHLVGLLLVVAVGSNYSLFFDWLRHQRLQRRGHAGLAAAGQPDHRAVVRPDRGLGDSRRWRRSVAWWRPARCWRCCCRPPTRRRAVQGAPVSS